MASAENSISVHIDVDGEEFQKVLDNIGEGFREQGKRIRNLWISQGFLVVGVLGHQIAHWIR